MARKIDQEIRQRPRQPRQSPREVHRDGASTARESANARHRARVHGRLAIHWSTYLRAKKKKNKQQKKLRKHKYIYKNQKRERACARPMPNRSSVPRAGPYQPTPHHFVYDLRSPPFCVRFQDTSHGHVASSCIEASMRRNVRTFYRHMKHCVPESGHVLSSTGGMTCGELAMHTIQKTHRNKGAHTCQK